MKSLPRCFGLVAAMLLASAAAVGGTALAAPTTLSYVGELRAENGLPYSGHVAVQASLWSAGSGGELVRPLEDLGLVAVDAGILHFDIGTNGTPIESALAGQSAVWLEIDVDGVAMAPRQKLEVAPFALRAMTAEYLGTAPAAAYVTWAELGAAASRAASSAVPPTSPAAGALWWNTDAQVLHVYNSEASEWVAVSAAVVAPENLPGDGIAVASNHILSNEFFDVTHTWDTGAPIQDATQVGPGAPAVAELVVVESSSSFINSIRVESHFSLNSSNDIKMILHPPAGMGPPISLREAVLTFGPYGDIWTVANVPELGELIGKNPSGTWTLVVVDYNDNLSNQGPNISGQLHNFVIVYDVVRSDELGLAGTLTADVVIAEAVEGTLVTSEDVQFEGDLRVTGPIFRQLQFATFNETVADAAGVKRQMTFTKKYDETWLRIEWNDNTYINSTAARYFDIRLNNNNCNSPHNLRTYQQAPNSTNGYERVMNHFVGYCNRFAGITTNPLVNGGVNIPAGEYTVQVVAQSTGQQIGWSNSMGSLTVEEIFPPSE